jgi:hypothetical protein
MTSTIRLIAALAACAALSSPALGLTQAELDEIDEYLARYMNNVKVLKQVTNTRGDVISCVDIDHQPAMNHPSWSGTVQREISPEGRAAFPGVIVPRFVLRAP